MTKLEQLEAEQIPGKEREEQSPFELLLAELSSRFMNLPSERVDGAIDDAQRVMCERFDLDRSSLFQCLEAGTSMLVLTHIYEQPDLPFPVLKRMDPLLRSEKNRRSAGQETPLGFTRVDCKEMYPWFYAQVRQGRTVAVPDVQSLGQEAARDKENLGTYGTQSTVVVPMFVGGVWLGILTFGMVRERRAWPDVLLKRFQFIADMFANALARRRAEDALRESEARFRVVADSAPVLIWMSGPDKLCTFFNKSWLDFTGRTAEQEMGRGWADGVHAADLPACLKIYEESFEARQPFAMQYRLRRHDGEYRWISDRGVPRYDAEGRFAGFIGSCVDVTERQCAEDRLRQSEERFRQVAENVGDFIWEADATGLYTYASRAVERFLGYAPEELVGKLHFYDLFASDVREELKAAAFSVFAERRSFRAFPNPNVRKDGKVVYLETSGVPILDTAGNLIGYRGADTDVTERKLAEAALHRSWAEIQRLKDRLQVERDYLRTEITVTQSFGEIIGQSPAVKRVLHQVEQVAPADCPVLITGETGTGKELIARAVHRLSGRRDRSMVKVNCAALPSALVESELFGRERGAYTGALTSQTGRFEVADGSTIFLDEVGELTPEVQAKLLRVLQDGEFERLGSPKVHKVNVRVIAATNRDLADCVRQGQFRMDLFYRLSVFPIRVPPLRERTEDIPPLVSTFVTEFASRMGKKILRLPKRTIDGLQRYCWPGNIRELRNVLEHAVILSNDDVLRVPPLVNSTFTASPPTTIAEMEREHILKALERTSGRIKGPHGAGRLLGMNPGTLYSRMRKLGIPNRRQRDEMQSRS